MEKIYLDLSKMLKAISDPKRLRIIDMLSCGELCGCELLDAFHITQPTLSHDMKVLKEAGLVTDRKDGKNTMYSLVRGNLDWLHRSMGRIIHDGRDCICHRKEHTMHKIRIFEPALCCETGVCGVDVDPELLRITTTVRKLKQEGEDIKRHNLKNDPMEFNTNPVINKYVNEKGLDGLPCVVVDEKVTIESRYPTDQELLKIMDLPTDYLDHIELDAEEEKEETESCCCGGDGCC